MATPSDTPSPSPAGTTLTLLSNADEALLRTVDALSPEELAKPTDLPGWSRAHVVAHVALNGEALERVLTGRRQGRPTTMYDSQQARDADIETLAGGDARELRDRLFAATHRFSEAVRATTAWEGTFERTPGGQLVPVVAVPVMRLREVEIHHADLGSGYSHADWSPEFAVQLLDSVAGRSTPEPFVARAPDLDLEWGFGEGDDRPVVVGDAAALAWWITGRGTGEGLSCDTGALPTIEGW